MVLLSNGCLIAELVPSYWPLRGGKPGVFDLLNCFGELGPRSVFGHTLFFFSSQ